MSDRDASLDEASNIAFKALKEKPPAKPVDLYWFKTLVFMGIITNDTDSSKKNSNVI